MNVLIVGLGRTGLPQALTLAKSGQTVVGLDNDAALVGQINSGDLPFWEPKLDELLEEMLSNGNFRATTSANINPGTSSFDAIVISIGAPVDSTPESFVELISKTGVVNFIEGNSSAETLLLNRATVPVGSTQAISKYLESELGGEAFRSVHIAHVPERIAEGKAVDEEWTLPKLVGSETQAGFDFVGRLFSGFDAEVIRLPSPAYTEFGKLMENAWRDLTFAFSNDVALLGEELNLDARKILDAANYDYPRNSIPKPGPVSGYCLSKDPLLFDSSREAQILDSISANTLPGVGRVIHKSTIDHIVSRVLDSVDGELAPEIALIGMSFKPNVDDFRESHALIIAESLLQQRPDVVLHCIDPYIDSNRYTVLPPDLLDSPHRSYKWMSEIDCSTLSAAVICTPHDQMWPDSEASQNSMSLRREFSGNGNLRLVYDCSGAFADTELSSIEEYGRLGLPNTSIERIGGGS